MKKMINNIQAAWIPVCFLLLLFTSVCYGQTFVTEPMTGTPVSGEYYNNTSVTVSPTFIFTATPGQSLRIYTVAPNCAPLSAVPTISQNYVMTSVPRIGGITTSLGLLNRTTCDVMQLVQYVDGLGRPLQDVQVKASPTLKDIVQPYEYDALGREIRKYLPYALKSGASNGSYKPDALLAGLGQSDFYAAPPAGVSGNAYPYTQTVYELSPAGKVLEQGAPGTAWQPYSSGISGSGHTVRMTDAINNGVDLSDTAQSRQAALYQVSAISGTDQSRTLSRETGAAGWYAVGQLYVSITHDENWTAGRGGTTEEYKDKEGQVVLKRTFNYSGSMLQILSTYYVYDRMGYLAYVLPPMSGADGAQPTQAILDNLCYQYRYDDRGRLTQKKLPGKGWEFMIYNKLDKIVATQDAMQRHKANQDWTITKYDALGRAVLTGIYQYGATADVDYRATIQGQADGVATLWEAPTGTAANYGYTTVAFPISGISQVLTVNYYDNYSIANLPGAYSAPLGASAKTRGLMTASQTNVLGTANMLWKASYYDDNGRAIKTYSQHYLGAAYNVGNYDAVTTSYDFSDAVTATTRQHFTLASAANAQVTVSNTYTYDHMGRKLKTFEQINNGTNMVLAQQEYNEAGQLYKKSLHSEDNGASYLQTLTNGYNERGWLLSSASNTGLFNYSLYYNGAAANKQYNGNIAAMDYTKTGAGNVSFTYSYDQLNRLKSAASTGGSTLNETITYNSMGNITGLVRGGNLAANLAYTYYNSGLDNRLQTVTNNLAAFRSYVYDVNGNATSDGVNKTLTYNMLNLPQEVKSGSTTVATYTYDGTGNKLRNTGSDGSWDYVDGIVYKNGSISFVQTDEGRAELQGGTYHYEYNLKDQLGNTRLSFDRNPSIPTAARRIQEDEYYAFGLRNTGGYDYSNNNRYLYNGKEIQTDLTNQYDYGARFYDPVIGRWTSVDPMAEEGRRWSPYTYAFSNPMRFTDPDGMWPDCKTCDLLIGYAAAVVDNNTGGLLPVRQLAGHLVSDAKSFNRGQDAGDIASVIQGGAEVNGGSATASAALTVTAGSGGLTAEVSLPVAAVGGLVAVHGAITGAHGVYSLASQKGRLKETGSYTNTHESGKKYHGKGDKARASESGKKVAKENNDPHVDTDHTPAENDRQAFKDEDKRMNTDEGGHKSDANYNKRASPGKKYNAQDNH
ncbi:DUF6443 domain-containing protein [Mucilaginibacter sp.]|jgi:RHS repeat-associated protein|uniref:DUF6443 domain-containing protein n=1 Tax=Mucilaginibacter sp. TaxID=1882438 RepID=UPI003564AB60